jgi:hypothetical protein
LEKIKPFNEALPTPKESLIEIVLSMSNPKQNENFKINYIVKLITKHEVVVEYSDVFVKNTHRMLNDCEGYSYEHMEYSGRRYIGIKMEGTINPG